MTKFESPFLQVPKGDWLCANDMAFAIFDGFPVSPGHVLVTTRRIVETWFDASDDEQAALMALVKEVKHILDLQLDPKPDGYNVGFNSGAPPAKPFRASTLRKILRQLQSFGHSPLPPGTPSASSTMDTERRWRLNMPA